MNTLYRIYRSLLRLLGIVKRDKSLLFTRNNIRVDHDIDYGDTEIVAYIEVWFDAEAKFGIKLSDEEFINLYAVLNPYTEKLRVEYIIYRYDGRPDELHTYTALTQAEKNLICEMIEETSMKETGMTVKDKWLEFACEESDECQRGDRLTIYSADTIMDFVVDLKAAVGTELTLQQGKLLINYMEGNAYAFGLSRNALFRIDINEKDSETVSYSVQDAVYVILEWMNEFSQDAGETNLEDYSLADMVDEHSFNAWRGGIYGSWNEREKTREYLRQLKLDELELRFLASKLEVIV